MTGDGDRAWTIGIIAFGEIKSLHTREKKIEHKS